MNNTVGIKTKKHIQQQQKKVRDSGLYVVKKGTNTLYKQTN